MRQPTRSSSSAGTGTKDEKPSALLLVRCWLEPAQSGEPVVRGYIRDLRSGNEIAIANLKAVEEQVRRQLHTPHRSNRSTRSMRR